MGIIVAALVATGHLTVSAGQKPEVPFWVVLVCHAAMGLGTLSGDGGSYYLSTLSGIAP
jgi:PiT family inorganic phosphate transporter